MAGERPGWRTIGCMVCLLLAPAVGLRAGAAEEWSATVARQATPAVVLVGVWGEGEDDAGMGSGFIISSDGLVVTNYHVVKGKAKAFVKLNNRSFLPIQGAVRSFLPLVSHDLVVLKCDSVNLPVLSFRDSAPVVGESVATIGSPEGLEASVATGIVSAVRDLDNGIQVIQTTAPISHGSSGGPLLDKEGKVIGVTSAFLSEGQNLNFAVPVEKLASVLSEVTADGKKDVVSLQELPSAIDGDVEFDEAAANRPDPWGPPVNVWDTWLRLIALQRAAVFGDGQNLAELGCLSKVDIVVESLSEDAESAGLTTSFLKGYLETVLRRGSVLVVSSEAADYLYVNLNCVETRRGWVAYNLSLELKRPALLTVPSGMEDEAQPVKLWASVWRRAVLGSWQASDMVDSVTDSIDTWAAELSRDVQRANPAKEDE